MDDIFDRSDHEITFRGTKLIIKNHVFNPDLANTNSTSILINNIPNLSGKDVLDMGCGSGVISIYSALNGARNVVAVDNDINAIKNTKLNVQLNKVGRVVRVIKSNLFDDVTGKFDYILANLPISDKHWKLDVSTFDLLKSFISQSENHVKVAGKVYFVWSSDSPISPVREYLKLNRFKFREFEETKLNHIWYLFQIDF